MSKAKINPGQATLVGFGLDVGYIGEVRELSCDALFRQSNSPLSLATAASEKSPLHGMTTIIVVVKLQRRRSIARP